LQDVLGWPAWVVSSLREYLGHEPAPIERLEYAMAQGAAIYVNSNRAKGSPSRKVTDFMLFNNAWKPTDDDDEESSLEDLMREMGGRVR